MWSASVDFGITAGIHGRSFPVRCPHTRAVRFVHEAAKHVNEGLTKARPQHEEVAASLAVPSPSPRNVERKQVYGKRRIIHARAFWGWLGGRIWPLMRRGGRRSVCRNSKSPMSGWLKKLLFGIWGILLIPLIAPALKRWLDQNVFTDAHQVRPPRPFVTLRRPAVFSHLVALGEQPWFKLAVVFLTGLIAGVSLEWFCRKSGEKRAAELRSLGWKFRSLSESIRLRTASSDWPDSVQDLKPAMLLRVRLRPEFRSLGAERLARSSCRTRPSSANIFACVGKHLEDGDFDEAGREAQSWRPFLDQTPRA